MSETNRGDSSSPDFPAETPTSTTLSFRQRVGKIAVSTIVTIAFLGLGFLGIRGFLNRQWVLAAICVPASWMCIPWVDHTASIHERATSSIAAVFAFVGLVGFIALYFLMFQLAWFEAIFNGKGAGEGGLIFSALGGLAVGGIVGTRVATKIFERPRI